MNPASEDQHEDLPVELVGYSDRACAIVAGAILETLLERLLRKSMVPNTTEVLFAKYGPLNSFAAKIDLARALGLITRVEVDDLHRIRRIRNEFAHSLEPMSFTTSPVRDHVAQLRFRRSTITKLATTMRTDFHACVAMLTGWLRGRIERAVTPAVPPEFAESLLTHRHGDAEGGGETAEAKE